MQHLIDSAVQVATCNRCRAYVFLADVSGMRTTADIAPLDADGVRAALLAGRRLFDQLDQAGRPWRLQARTAASSWPPRGNVLGEHACGAMGRDAVGVTVVPPRSSGATSTVRQTVAPDGAYHPSNDIWRCMACHALIKAGESFYGIEHGYYRWARHDRDCAPTRHATL